MPVKKPGNKAQIGFLPTGLHAYWGQFEGLKNRVLKSSGKMEKILSGMGEVVSYGLIDTPEKSRAAGELFQSQKVDVIIIFPLAYGTSALIIPAVNINKDVPLIILNSHEDATRDYSRETTADYLHHEGVCCVPEFAGALKWINRNFRIITGIFDDEKMQRQLSDSIHACRSANIFKEKKVGYIGHIYPGMIDMPVDEIKILRACGTLLEHVEVEEVVQAFDNISHKKITGVIEEFKRQFRVDRNVPPEYLRYSARICAAFDEVIRRHNIGCFGFYWWGQNEKTTQIRAQSNLALTRLTTRGIPGVTEGDIKTAMAIKITNLLGGGGTLGEFFAMDFKEDFILMGHDGPANTSMADKKPTLVNLDVLHGKTGYGIGIDMSIRPGTVTLLNISQFEGETLKLTATTGECVEGDVLKIGNPNYRIKVNYPLDEFFSRWCAEGPTHHVAVGLGDLREKIGIFADVLGLKSVIV